MKQLASRIALVTGASRGIGRSIAIALAKESAIVAIHYGSSADGAAQTLAAIKQAGGDGFIVQAELSAASGARDLTAAFLAGLATHSARQSFDILVNNAGIDKRQTIDQVSEADFDRMFQINFKTPFFLIQALLPHLNDGGRIINLSSMAARAAYPTMPVYAPTKAAIEVLSRLLAVQLGPRGITVNAVSPGATATDMNPRASDPDASRVLADTIALGRVGQPEDIASVVVFLAGAAGGWVTGQSLDASGGQRL
jgi:3-oxoacyl-[acyl-carrier protein] reductase